MIRPAHLRILSILIIFSIITSGYRYTEHSSVIHYESDNQNIYLPMVMKSLVGDPYLATLYHLPEGYKIRKYAVPPITAASTICHSEDGTIYIRTVGLNEGMSIYNPNTGQVKQVISTTKGQFWGVCGPGNSAFVMDNNEIWQIRPDGSHSTWSTHGGNIPVFYTKSGKMIGVPMGDWTRVVQIFPDGQVIEIASGFTYVMFITGRSDDTLFVSDYVTGDVVRINPDGSTKKIISNLIYRDPIQLGFDPSEDLYLTKATLPNLYKVDQDSGALTPLMVNDFLGFDFTFINQTELLVLGPTGGMVTRANLSNQTTNIAVSHQGVNGMASTVDPYGSVYVADNGYHGNPPGRINKITFDGKITKYVDNLPDYINDLRFSKDGTLFITANPSIPGTPPIYYVSPGDPTPHAVPGADWSGFITPLPNGNMLGYTGNNFIEFSTSGKVAEYPFSKPEAISTMVIDAAPDGSIYGSAIYQDGIGVGPQVNRRLLKIDLNDGTSKVIFDHPFQGSMPGTADISIGSDGSIYLIYAPDSEIYKVQPDGSYSLLAQDIPIDAWTINADIRGHVIFTSSEGLMEIFR